MKSGSQTQPKIKIVLDQNFPIQATGLRWPAWLEVTRLVDAASDLTQAVDDWEVMSELDRRGVADVFVTNDGNILKSAREMVVLGRTRLALVIVDGVGHDALRATGLLMTYLPAIAGQVGGRPKIFVLRPGPLVPRAASDYLERIAEHQSRPTAEIVQEAIEALPEEGFDI